MLLRTWLYAAVVAAVASVSGAALAGAEDYAFQPVAAEVKAGKGITLAVRLVHKPSGRPVSDAVLFRTRLDMSPDRMGDMVAPLTPVPGGEPGVYAFKTDLSMGGRWALKLMAKVQGEAESIQATIIFTAKP